MDLEKEYTEETGLLSYDKINCEYNTRYVDWLEEKIEQLRLNPSSLTLPCRLEINLDNKATLQIDTTDKNLTVKRAINKYNTEISIANITINEVPKEMF